MVMCVGAALAGGRVAVRAYKCGSCRTPLPSPAVLTPHERKARWDYLAFVFQEQVTDGTLEPVVFKRRGQAVFVACKQVSDFGFKQHFFGVRLRVLRTRRTADDIDNRPTENVAGSRELFAPFRSEFFVLWKRFPRVDFCLGEAVPQIASCHR